METSAANESSCPRLCGRKERTPGRRQFAVLLAACAAAAAAAAVSGSPTRDGPSPSPFACRVMIDLNSASCGDLSLIPGIGPSLARRIVLHRGRYGGFETGADLRFVRGLPGPAMRAVEGFVTAGRPAGKEDRR